MSDTASPSAVLGWRRHGNHAPWWEATKIGKPITPRLAYYLRRAMWSSTPGNVQKALAERGLLLEPGTTSHDRLTPEGRTLRCLLGEVPAGYWPNLGRHYQGAPSEGESTCPACGGVVSAELMAWAVGVCLACALTREDET